MPWSFALPQELFTSPILSVVTPVTAGMLVGYGVNGGRRNTQKTYRSLRKPPFYPPPWLFAPVWTVLYGTVGYAAHHATMTGLSALASPATQDLTATSQTLYTSQLALNYLWMPFFFGLRKPKWALADILLLGANVGYMMSAWWRVDRTAFWLTVPYMAWIGFATYLNAGFGYLNGWVIGEDEVEKRE